MATGLRTLLRVFLMNSHLGHEEVTLCFGALRPSCCLLSRPSVPTVSLHPSTLVLAPFLQELLHRLLFRQQLHFLRRDPVVHDPSLVTHFLSKFQDFTQKPKIGESREESPDVSEQIEVCPREWPGKSKCGQNRACAEPSKKLMSVSNCGQWKNVFYIRRKMLAGWGGLGWAGLAGWLGWLGGLGWPWDSRVATTFGFDIHDLRDVFYVCVFVCLWLCFCVCSCLRMCLCVIMWCHVMSCEVVSCDVTV